MAEGWGIDGGRWLRATAVLWVADREKHFSAIICVLVECVPVEEGFQAGNFVLVGRIQSALISFYRGVKRNVGDAGVVLIAATLALGHQLSAHSWSEHFALRDYGHLFSGSIFLGAGSNVTPTSVPHSSPASMHASNIQSATN